MDLFVLYVVCMTVFVNCLEKQFAICLGIVMILLLIFMEVLSVGGSVRLERPCMVFQRMCVFLFVFVYVGSNLLIYKFVSRITEVCSPHVVSLCDVAYYVVV